jgi:hypothetical protein
MIEDILDIKLLPVWNSPSVRPTLSRCIQQSQLLQAAIAYWTVDGSVFGRPLVERISPPNGFLCADLHMPTDIDALAALVRNGAHVRLFCEDITTYRADGKKEPPFLLHTKFLLFLKRDKTAELWVGSHNWTNRALMGLNIESSLVIQMRDSARLFFEAVEYLEKVKSVCEVFDLNKVEFYKELQRNIDERTVPVIEVEASGANGLSGMEISIFGTNDQDLKELGTVHRKVFLSATENDRSEAEFVYPARIIQAGELNSANPSAGRLDFSPRRYAFRSGRRLPELLQKSNVSRSLVDSAKYYVTLQLGAPDNSLKFDYPRGKSATWEVTEEERSPLIRRLASDDLAVLFRGREPRLKLPVRTESESSALTLYEKRNMPERSFLTRRVLKKR